MDSPPAGNRPPICRWSILKPETIYTVKYPNSLYKLGARCGVFFEARTLQVGRSRFRFPYGVAENVYCHNPSGRTQPLTDMSTRDISLRIKAVGA